MTQITDLAAQRLMDLQRDLPPLSDGEVGRDGHGHLRVQPVPHPARPRRGDALNARDVGGGATNGLEHSGLDAVEHAEKDRLRRLADEVEDGDGDPHPHDRVGQRVAEVEADGSEQDGQAGQPIDAGVIAVGHQGGAADLLAHPDAEDRHRLVPDEADHRRRRDRAQVADRAGWSRRSTAS